MITEAVVIVADYATGLGLDAFKQRIRCGIDEKKLKANFCSGEDNTVIETLKIPDKINQE